ESNSPPQQLFQYFHPNKPKDTRIKAWIYAHTTCQVNMLSLFAHLFSTQNTLPIIERLLIIRSSVRGRPVEASPVRVLASWLDNNYYKFSKTFI
ncbi:hypothetical protein, partial [Legionella sp.]|uniref:hypothetical protein n=1 Tax=Legionella sp. TaxID=459 RepID=UPI003CC2B349